MQRKKFIQVSAMGLIGLSSVSFADFQSPFDKKDLMGKGNPTLMGEGYKLRKKAHQAFLKMKSAALKQDIKIKVVSSYRDYEHQNRIWERKYERYTESGLSPIKAIRKIIEYSTIPGTSRHHWGTDLDIVDGSVKQPRNVLLEKHFHNGGAFTRFKTWMDHNASDFGFYLVYTNKKGRKGFKYEPWHYSYAPSSIPMLKEFKKLDIKTELQKTVLMGSSSFTSEFIQQYMNRNVLDINPKLL
ncbi:M15 family metallopeptidase [Aquimarina sp. RZ0]|uniref:M15 family metallopeptidase n=1 Tax=Aquimarina sp. RZ0 TaxID=2607730 RepID=UPI0011F2311D|nr:M15 family metallopeptidase [Aquimarina sp. RZ0]KAA1243223.1 M15 family metallopeptidase [Aquimarina sp. RZ0]